MNVRHHLDVAAIITALLAWLDAIQGALAAVASILSITWLAIQIGGWFYKKFLGTKKHAKN